MKKNILLLIIFFTCLTTTSCSNKTNIIIGDNLDLEYGKIAYISDYITIQNGTLIDEEIIYDNLGKLKLEYNYLTGKNKEKSDYLEINIVDTSKPIIMLKDKLTLKLGYDKNIEEAVMCADNYDKNPICTIKGEYNVNKVGSYPLTFVATDSNNNKTEIDFTLNIIDKSNTYTNTYTYFDDIIKKHKKDNTSIGIDISKWQGEINFAKVKESGAEFVMIRIGVQNGFNGENIIDKYFKYNIEEALKNDLDVGVYFYSYATTKEEATNQANWVIEQLKNYKITLPVVFDWESWSSFNNLDISLFDITKIQEAFLDTISLQGYKTARYGSKNYLEKAFLDTKHKTWLAHYTDKTIYNNDYFMWQLCDDGIINGINGYVDIDIIYK